MYKRLAVALDGSPLAEKALPVAVQLAKFLPAQLLLLRVCREQSQAIHPDPDHPAMNSPNLPEKYLETIKERLTDPSKGWALPPETVQTPIHHTHAYFEFDTVAEAEDADLLIMTTHLVGVRLN